MDIVISLVVGACLGLYLGRMEKRNADLALRWKIYMRGMETGYTRLHLGEPEMTYHNTRPPQDLKAWWKDLGL